MPPRPPLVEALGDVANAEARLVVHITNATQQLVQSGPGVPAAAAAAVGAADELARARAARLLYLSVDEVRRIESDADAARRLAELGEWVREQAPLSADDMRGFGQKLSDQALRRLAGSLEQAVGRDLDRADRLLRAVTLDEPLPKDARSRFVRGALRRLLVESHADPQDPRRTLIDLLSC